MNKFTILAILILLFNTAPVFAKDAAPLKCDEVKVVLQHKTHAIKQVLQITLNPVTDSNGTRRCPSSYEIFWLLTNTFPEYLISEYEELSNKY